MSEYLFPIEEGDSLFSYVHDDGVPPSTFYVGRIVDEGYGPFQKEYLQTIFVAEPTLADAWLGWGILDKLKLAGEKVLVLFHSKDKVIFPEGTGKFCE